MYNHTGVVVSIFYAAVIVVSLAISLGQKLDVRPFKAVVDNKVIELLR